PTIAHVADGDFVVAEDADGQRREHPPLGAVLHPRVVDGDGSRVEHLTKELAWRLPGLGVGEGLNRPLAGELAGDLAVPVPADAVRENGDGPARTPFVGRARRPEIEAVFVVGAHRAW